MAPRERKPRCVLCQSCANWNRGSAQERRKSPRICNAGHDPTTDLFACESFVDRLLFRMPMRPARDWRRGPDWRSPEAFVRSQLRDSPDSWRANTAYGIWEFEEGDRRLGEAHLRRAIELWPHHARPYHLLADYYRGDGLCVPALPLYADAIAREPDRPRQRISAAACLVWEGQYAEAAIVARGPSMEPKDRVRLDAILVTADSADAAGQLAVRAFREAVRSGEFACSWPREDLGADQ